MSDSRQNNAIRPARLAIVLESQSVPAGEGLEIELFAEEWDGLKQLAMKRGVTPDALCAEIAEGAVTGQHVRLAAVVLRRPERGAR